MPSFDRPAPPVQPAPIAAPASYRKGSLLADWLSSTDPPHRHNVASIPRIRSERPAFDLNYPHIKSGRPPVPVGPGGL